MDWMDRTKNAFRKAVEREENLSRYAEKTGVAYPIVNRLRSGKTQFEKLELATFFRLFPELKVYFFRDEYPASPSLFRRNSVEIGGSMHGEIAQEGEIRKTVRNDPDNGGVDIKELRLKLKQSNKFSTEERLKILDFLDEEL